MCSVVVKDEVDRRVRIILRTGKTGASTEKQAIDCVLITKTNAGSLNNFVLTQ